MTVTSVSCPECEKELTLPERCESRRVLYDLGSAKLEPEVDDICGDEASGYLIGRYSEAFYAGALSVAKDSAAALGIPLIFPKHYHTPACELHLTWPERHDDYPVPEDSLTGLAEIRRRTKLELSSRPRRPLLFRVFARSSGDGSFSTFLNAKKYERWLSLWSPRSVIGVPKSSYQHPFAYFLQQSGFPMTRAVRLNAETHLADGSGGVYELPWSLRHIEDHLRSNLPGRAILTTDALEACRVAKTGCGHTLGLASKAM